MKLTKVSYICFVSWVTPSSFSFLQLLGQKFALMEEKVILASLLRKLSFKSCQSVEEVSPIGELILRPYKGIEMEISLRA